MTFTQDWFSSNIPNFEHIRAILSGNQNFLEVGSFEGRSTCWILENMLSDNGTIYCVDTFKGGQEHSDLNLTKLRDVFEENVHASKKPNQTVRVLEKDSYVALAELIAMYQSFDFIYVDGSHEAHDVLTDACLCFRLLKQGGVMLFDDYAGGQGVKDAFQMFYNAHHTKIEVVGVNYQIAVRKL